MRGPVDRLAQLQPDGDGSFVVLVRGGFSEDGLLLVPGADRRGWFGLTPAQLAALLPTEGPISIVPTGNPDRRLADFVSVLQVIRGVDNPIQFTMAATSITADGALRQGEDVPDWYAVGADMVAASGKSLWLIPSDASPHAVARGGFEAGVSALHWEAGASDVDMLAALASTHEARLYVALASDDEPVAGGDLPDDVSGPDVLGYLGLDRQGGQLTVHTFVSLPGAFEGIRGARPHVPDRLFGQLLMVSTQLSADTFALVASDAARRLASRLPAVAAGSRRVRYVAQLATHEAATIQVDLVNGKLHEPTVAAIVTELEGRAHSAGRPLELVLLSDPTANPRQLSDARHIAQWKAKRAGTGRTLINVATQTSSGEMQIIEPGRRPTTREPEPDHPTQESHTALPTIGRRCRPRPEDDDLGPARSRPRLAGGTAPGFEPLDDLASMARQLPRIARPENLFDEDTDDTDDPADDPDYVPGPEDDSEFEDDGWPAGDLDSQASTSESDDEDEPSDHEDLLPVDPERRLPDCAGRGAYPSRPLRDRVLGQGPDGLRRRCEVRRSDSAVVGGVGGLRHRTRMVHHHPPIGG